jgi:steroid 5-alpha reductase family enzyme
MSNCVSIDFVGTIYPYLLGYVVPSILMQLLINFPCSIFRLMDNFTGLVEYLPGVLLSFYWLFDSSKNFTDVRSILMNTCVMLWSIRLGGFLLYRMLKLNALDSRIENLLKKSGRRGLLIFWFAGHGLWSVICTSPVILVNALSHEESRWTFFDLFGFSLWTTGFLMESIADQQKLNSKCRGEKRYYRLGLLWNYTRNPNHCGEIFCWLGLSVVSLNIFFFHPIYRFNLCLLLFSQLGFVFTLCVMLFEATLSSETKNNQRYLSDRSYGEYRARTSLLWPVSPHIYRQLPCALRKTIFFQWDIYNQQETTLVEKRMK